MKACCNVFNLATLVWKSRKLRDHCFVVYVRPVIDWWFGSSWLRGRGMGMETRPCVVGVGTNKTVGIGWPRRECWWAPTLPPLPYHHLLLLIPTVGTSWWGSFEWCGLAVQTKGTGNKRGIVVLAWHMLQPPCVTFGARVFRWLERMAGTEEDRCSLYPIKSLIKKT